MYYLGNKELINLNKTAFLCSRRISAKAVLRCYDWAIEQREKGICVISGFHSQLEKDVFHFLAKGSQPIILIISRGMKTRWPEDLKKMIQENRLLIISPFEKSVTRMTQETAAIRNHTMCELADSIVAGYVNPNGKIAGLLKEFES